MVADLERRGDLSRPQVWQCPAKKWRVTGTADSQKRRRWDYGGTVNSELTTEPAPSVAVLSQEVESRTAASQRGKDGIMVAQ